MRAYSIPKVTQHLELCLALVGLRKYSLGRASCGSPSPLTQEYPSSGVWGAHLCGPGVSDGPEPPVPNRCGLRLDFTPNMPHGHLG